MAADASLWQFLIDLNQRSEFGEGYIEIVLNPTPVVSLMP